ncbi:MAG TPA: glutaminase, partial [Chitinophagaceae bacterium]|nr:glutaminase [Chitinophagaceae bacterium]
MKQPSVGASRIMICAVLLLCLQATHTNAQKKSKSKSGAQSEMQTQAPAYAISKERIEAVLNEAYDKYKDIKEGKNADYIKELAQVDPNIFGIAVVTADGQVFTKGDIQSMVSIQSVSKVFTMAQVIEEQGPKAVMDKIGVDA